MLINIKNHFKDICFKITNLIYNQKCIICGCAKQGDLLCKTCAKDVQFLSSFPHRIFENIPIYSAMNYEGIVKQLIHKLKFQHKKTAAIVLAQLLFQYFQKLDIKNDCILCYPSGFYLRNTSRGYNQMELITKEFSKLSQIEYIKDLILKIKYTKPQYKAKNKAQNILGSFKLDNSKLDKIKNKTIIILDDITTSGATINELITVFKKEKIKNIICLTIAKTKN